MARGRRGLNAVRDTPDWLFYMFMVAFALEYSGLPNQFPILKVARVTTLLTYLSVVITISKVGFGDLFKHKQTKLFMAFLVFTILSTLWAVVRTRAFDQIRPFVDYLFLFYLTASLIDRPKRFRVFGIVICVIVAWLIAKNLGRFGQEERAGAFAAAYFMGDGNDFAWGLVTLLPFMLYLVIGDHGVLLKLAGVAAMGITLFGIVGTSSRGATLGIGAAVVFYWWFMSTKKALGVALMVVGLIGVLAMAPSSYVSRIGSIGNASQDTSAQARLATWGAAAKMAVRFPLGVGAGNFASAYGRYYIGGGNSALGFAQNRWFSAHSIYFRTLGEYGFIGLFMLIWLIIKNVKDNLLIRATLMAQGAQAKISPLWPGVVGMATVGFAVCGIFLGGLTYPHLFMLAGITVASKRIMGMSDADAAGGRGRARGRAVRTVPGAVPGADTAAADPAPVQTPTRPAGRRR